MFHWLQSLLGNIESVSSESTPALDQTPPAIEEIQLCKKIVLKKAQGQCQWLEWDDATNSTIVHAYSKYQELEQDLNAYLKDCAEFSDESMPDAWIIQDEIQGKTTYKTKCYSEDTEYVTCKTEDEFKRISQQQYGDLWCETQIDENGLETSRYFEKEGWLFKNKVELKNTTEYEKRLNAIEHEKKIEAATTLIAPMLAPPLIGLANEIASAMPNQNVFNVLDRMADSFSIPGAYAQTITSAYPRYTFYINEENRVREPLYGIFGQNVTFNDVTNFDGSSSPLDLYFMQATYAVEAMFAMKLLITPQKDIIVSSGLNSIEIFNAQNSSSLKYTKQYQLSGQVGSGALNQNNELFIGISGTGLRKYNATNTTALTVMATIGGLSPACAEIYNGKIYVGEGNNFRVYDQSSMALLGMIALPSLVRNIKVIDTNTAVATVYSSGVFRIDITTDATLLVTASFAASSVQGIAMGNNGYFYAADSQRLYTFNATATPFIPINTFTSPSLSLVDMAYNNNTATLALAAMNDGVFIFNTTNPAVPQLIRRLDTPGTAFAPNFIDDKIVVGDYLSGLQVFEHPSYNFNIYKKPVLSERGIHHLQVKTDSNTTQLSKDISVTVSERIYVKTPQPPTLLTVKDYGTPHIENLSPSDLFTYSGEFVSLNITMDDGSPLPNWIIFAAPALDTFFPIDQGFAVALDAAAHAVGYINGYLYLLNRAKTNPTPKKMTIPTTGASAITFNGTTAFVGGSGISTLDTSDPDNPVITGLYSQPFSISKIRVDGDKLYINHGGSQIRQLNAANPNALSVLLTYTPTSPPIDLHVANGKVYVGTNNKLEILDKNTLTLLQSYPTTGPIYSVYAEGIYVYLGFINRVEIIKSNGISAPTLISNYPLDQQVRQLKMIGAKLIVAATTKTLILNVADPNNIQLEQTFPGATFGVAARDGRLFNAAVGSGYEGVDLANAVWRVSFTPSAAIVGNYRLKIRGINDLGVWAETFYTIRIGGAPIATFMPSQIAYVDQQYDAYMPQGTFNFPNSDATGRYTFTGLPPGIQCTDQGDCHGKATVSGIYSPTVTATTADGSASLMYNFTTTQLLRIKDNPPSQLLPIGKPYRVKLDLNSIFLEPDGETYITQVLQATNKLPFPDPTIINYDPVNQEIFGTAVNEDEYNLILRGIEPHNGITDALFSMRFKQFPNATIPAPTVVGVKSLFNIPIPSFTGTGLSYQLANTPPTVTLKDQAIKGTLDINGTYTFDLIATDADSASIKIPISVIAEFDPEPNVVIGKLTFNLNEPMSFPIPANPFKDLDNPEGVAISVSGLPAWATYNNSTISGTPPSPGDFSFTITGTDVWGRSANIPVSGTIVPIPQLAASPPPQIAFIGQGVEIPLSSFFNDNGLTFTVSGLPSGIIYDASRKVITGTGQPSDAEKSYVIQVTARNASGGIRNIPIELKITYQLTVDTLPDFFPQVGHAFNRTVDLAEFITNRSNRPLNFSLINDSKNPGTWLNATMNNSRLMLQGIPPKDATPEAFAAQVSDALGQVVKTFTVTSIPNNPPKIVTRTQTYKAIVTEKSTFTPATAEDADGDKIDITHTSTSKKVSCDSTGICTADFDSRRDTNTFSANFATVCLKFSDRIDQVEFCTLVSIEGDSWAWVGLTMAGNIGLAITGLTMTLGILRTLYNKLSCFHSVTTLGIETGKPFVLYAGAGTTSIYVERSGCFTSDLPLEKAFPKHIQFSPMQGMISGEFPIEIPKLTPVSPETKASENASQNDEGEEEEKDNVRPIAENSPLITNGIFSGRFDLNAYNKYGLLKKKFTLFADSQTALNKLSDDPNLAKKGYKLYESDIELGIFSPVFDNNISDKYVVDGPTPHDTVGGTPPKKLSTDDDPWYAPIRGMFGSSSS